MGDTEQMLLRAGEWGLPLCFAVLGACIGSFLNVVIYRIPRGMSVREPKRSFCPTCGAAIPWYLNLPIVSWLLLRGRSACCHKPIAARYCLVEAACMALFFSIAWYFSYEPVAVQALLCAWAACMLAMLAMDWEQMVVYPPLAVGAAVCGLGTAICDPCMVEPTAASLWEGLLWSVAGAGGGYMLFRLVALGGRLLFGRRKLSFPHARPWLLRQVGEDIILSLDGEDYRWSEIFIEPAHKITLLDAELADRPGEVGSVTFEAGHLLLPGGSRHSLEEFDSLSGVCRGLLLHREAMGSGDAWLAAAIGALCGCQGVVFALVAGSVIGIVHALIMRIGRGAPMPFGPALILAAFLWLFWGPQILTAYFSLI